MQPGGQGLCLLPTPSRTVDDPECRRPELGREPPSDTLMRRKVVLAHSTSAYLLQHQDNPMCC